MSPWRIAKWALPIVILVAGAFLLWNSLWQQTTFTEREISNLQSQLNDRESYSKTVDQLRQSAGILDQFIDTIGTVKNQNVPSIDSLRRFAEKMDLQVLDMMQEKSTPSGYRNMYRFDLEAEFSELVAWLDSLEYLQPNLQLDRLQWSHGRKGDRITVYYGGIESETPIAKDTIVQPWLVRAKFALSGVLAQADSSKALRNPFRGNVVERTVIRVAAPAAGPPKQPAPVLNIVGLVAGRMATVQLPGGERKLLKAGDALGDWQVESISASSLTLRNGDQSKTYNSK